MALSKITNVTLQGESKLRFIHSVINIFNLPCGEQFFKFNQIFFCTYKFAFGLKLITVESWSSLKEINEQQNQPKYFCCHANATLNFLICYIQNRLQLGPMLLNISGYLRAP